MRKIATVVATSALAAGVVLVPAAGFASAATTHAVTTSSPVAQVHPRYVDVWDCQAFGGQVFYDLFSPSGYVCIGGYYDGEVVW